METLAVEFVRESELVELRTAALQTCLEKLGDRERRIIEARYRDGATMQTLAEEFSRPSSTLYKTVARIRRRLYTCIEGTLDRIPNS